MKMYNRMLALLFCKCFGNKFLRKDDFKTGFTMRVTSLVNTRRRIGYDRQYQ